MRHDYATRIDGSEHSVPALLGRGADGGWEQAWVDSFHTGGTGVMLSRGVDSRDGRVSVVGSYPVDDGPPWGWRTEYELGGDDTLVVRHWNVSPEGEQALAVQFDLERVGG